MMHDGVYLKRGDTGTYTTRKEAARHGTEQTVIKMRDKIIDEALCSGVDVISDDTNLYAKPLKDLRRLAARCGADVEFIDLTHVSLETCLERNTERQANGARGVPDAVIRDMYERYVKGKGYPLPVPKLKDNDKVANMVPYTEPVYGSVQFDRPAVIFDIDGTVAHMNGRSPYDYTQVLTDTPDDVLYEIVCMYVASGYHIIFLSGRKSECREDTVKWLQEHFELSGSGVYSSLFMRPDGDNRADQIVKYELFDQHVRPHYAVRCVYDDRNRVVEMWRKLGLKCLQVEPGDF
jgi:predicted kinase